MSHRSSPFNLFFDTMKLASEAHAVVALRAFGFTTSKTTAREASLMVSEKMEALFRAQNAAAVAILTGRAPFALPAAVSVYRRVAKANRQRLSRRSHK
jgi:hypothetical protein